MLCSSCEGEEWEIMWEKQPYIHQGHWRRKGKRWSRCRSKDFPAAHAEDHGRAGCPPLEWEGPHQSRYPPCSPWRTPHQSKDSYLYIIQASKLGKDPSIDLSTFSQTVEQLDPDTQCNCKAELHFSQLWGKITRNIRKKLLETVNSHGRGMRLINEIKTVRSLNQVVL